MHIKELDSISLMRLCGESKDDAVWQEFLFRFLPKIKMYIIGSCRKARRKSSYLSSQISLIPEQEVDDLAQQVLLRTTEKDRLLLKRFTGKTEGDICAYLYVLARSVTQNYFKELRRQKRPQIEYSLDDLSQKRTRRWSKPSANMQIRTRIEESLLRKELIERLYAAVRNRYSSGGDPDRAAIVFELYFFQGLTQNEISKCRDVNLSQSSISKLISTWKRNLPQHVKAGDKNGSLIEPNRDSYRKVT